MGIGGMGLGGKGMQGPGMMMTGNAPVAMTQKDLNRKNSRIN